MSRPEVGPDQRLAATSGRCRPGSRRLSGGGLLGQPQRERVTAGVHRAATWLSASAASALTGSVRVSPRAASRMPVARSCHVNVPTMPRRLPAAGVVVDGPSGVSRHWPVMAAQRQCSTAATSRAVPSSRWVMAWCSSWRESQPSSCAVPSARTRLAQAGSVTARSAASRAGVGGDELPVAGAAHHGGQVGEDDPQPGDAGGLLVQVACDVGDRRRGRSSRSRMAREDRQVMLARASADAPPARRRRRRMRR